MHDSYANKAFTQSISVGSEKIVFYVLLENHYILDSTDLVKTVNHIQTKQWTWTKWFVHLYDSFTNTTNYNYNITIILSIITDYWLA